MTHFRDEGARESVYIAGPMTDIEAFNYPAFAAAAADLRDHGYHVVSPHELHDGDLDQDRSYYLRRDIAAMLDCDVVALLPGWPLSEGALLEAGVASHCGLKVVPLASLLGEAE